MSWLLKSRHLSLVNPVVGSRLVAVKLAGGEPKSDLSLGVLDGVGTVADVATDILRGVSDWSSVRVSRLAYDGEVTTDGAGGRGGGVGGSEEDTSGLDGITTLPDHGADGAGVHVGDQTGEERLAGEVGVCGAVSVFCRRVKETGDTDSASQGAPCRG